MGRMLWLSKVVVLKIETTTKITKVDGVENTGTNARVEWFLMVLFVTRTRSLRSIEEVVVSYVGVHLRRDLTK